MLGNISKKNNVASSEQKNDDDIIIEKMNVRRSDGKLETVSFDKIIFKIYKIARRLKLTRINPFTIAQETVEGLYNNITTEQIDLISSIKAAEKIQYDPEYNMLAAALCIDRLHKKTDSNFMDVTDKLYNNRYIDYRTNDYIHKPRISDQYYKFVSENIEVINQSIDYERDFEINFFGFKTLERSYLKKIGHFSDLTNLNLNINECKEINKKSKIIIERPQHMFMRVALAIHINHIDDAIKCYNLMSQRYYTHASPTLFNAGTTRPQLSSCFLLNMHDSIEGMYNETISRSSKISKYAGGIGITIGNIRSKGSLIRGTDGESDGIVPLIKVLNNVSRHVNQSGKRNGAFALYLPIWHSECYDFCEMRRNTGLESMRARDLFYGLWICDLFMKRCEEETSISDQIDLLLNDGKSEESLKYLYDQLDKCKWSLMCPDQCPGLTETYGQEFDKLYLKYEKEGKVTHKISPNELFDHVNNSQIETGMPYIHYSDSVNEKSNQKNIGTIQSSNLCVHGDTPILTDRGYIQISSLQNLTINVWNGSEWSEVTVIKTGENVDMVNVFLSNYTKITCTPYHKFYCCDENQNTSVVCAVNLKKGQNLIKFNLPLIEFDGSNDMKYPYTHGYSCSDKCSNLNNDNSYIELENKFNIAKFEYLKLVDMVNRYDLYFYDDILHKYYVPHGNSLTTRIRWFNGLIDSPNCNLNINNKRLEYSSKNREFLTQIRLMLQTLGVETNVDASTLLNNDEYYLHIDFSVICKLMDHGLEPELTNYLDLNIKDSFCDDDDVYIIDVSDNSAKYDSYCFSEPKKHMGMFNGILTGQCAEIVEYTSREEVAVCNLSSICLPMFVKKDENDETYFDYDHLCYVAQFATKSLNRVIDVNFYPVKEAEVSNVKHRPLGIGVQGLSDVYNLFKYPFESNKALTMNKKIFETIYYGVLKMSNELAIKDGHYNTFPSSPFSEGKLQFHLWGISEKDLLMQHENEFNVGKDWPELINSIKKYGTRNSLLTSLMPTASTSQIMGNTESFEPCMTNVYTRSTATGDFVIFNKYLVYDLMELGLWNDDMRETIIYDGGSIKNINDIPDNIKEVYKTAFEMKMKSVVQQSIDRGPFIDQSQSKNLFIGNPDPERLKKALFYSWKNGDKTGIYYLRSKPSKGAVKFGQDQVKINKINKNRSDKKLNKTIDNSQINKNVDNYQKNKIDVNSCSINGEYCEACGS